MCAKLTRQRKRRRGEAREKGCVTSHLELVSRTLTRQPRPYSGLDCLTCAKLARQRKRRRGEVTERKRASLQPLSRERVHDLKRLERVPRLRRSPPPPLRHLHVATAPIGDKSTICLQGGGAGMIYEHRGGETLETRGDKEKRERGCITSNGWRMSHDSGARPPPPSSSSSSSSSSCPSSPSSNPRLAWPT